MENKICNKCHKKHPIEFYYIDRTMTLGRSNSCKSCTAKRILENRNKKKEHYDMICAAYGRTEKALAQKRAYAKTERRRLVKEIAVAKNRNKYPEKYYARVETRKAILRGDLKIKPCSRCGTKTKVHAHHEDYSKIFDIVWLCYKHHAERHREINELRRQNQKQNQKINTNIYRKKITTGLPKES
jgi:hypothetical protein